MALAPLSLPAWWLLTVLDSPGCVSGFHMSPPSWGFRWSLLLVFCLLFFAALFPLLSSFPSAPTLAPSVAAPWGSFPRLPDVQAGLGMEGEAFQEGKEPAVRACYLLGTGQTPGRFLRNPHSRPSRGACHYLSSADRDAGAQRIEVLNPRSHATT